MLYLSYETVINRTLHETDLQNKNVFKHSAIYIYISLIMFFSVACHSHS